MKKYIVVVFYTFSTDTEAYEFDDYKKACDYLEAMWQDRYNHELAEAPERIDKEGTYHEEGYAQIKWGTEDNQLRIWQVAEISKPLKINGKDWS